MSIETVSIVGSFISGVVTVVLTLVTMLGQQTSERQDWWRKGMIVSLVAACCLCLLAFVLYLRVASPLVVRGLEQAEQNSANEFERGEFTEMAQQYRQMSTESAFNVTDGNETAYVMGRAMRAVPDGGTVEGITSYPPNVWNSELAPYLAANKEAIERHVTIKRIFLLPDNSSDLKGYLAAMESQAKLGVEVYYSFYEQLLELQRYFHDGSFYDCALFNGEYFGYDIKPEATRLRGPANSRFTWDKREMGERSPFPGVWNREYVHPFNNTAKKLIADHFRSTKK